MRGVVSSTGGAGGGSAATYTDNFGLRSAEGPLPPRGAPGRLKQEHVRPSQKYSLVTCVFATDIALKNTLSHSQRVCACIAPSGGEKCARRLYFAGPFCDGR